MLSVLLSLWFEQRCALLVCSTILCTVFTLAPLLSSVQLSRDKKMLDEKLQETQSALETEEGKSKSEHRARLKLESNIQELDEKLDREVAVSVPEHVLNCFYTFHVILF